MASVKAPQQTAYGSRHQSHSQATVEIQHALGEPNIKGRERSGYLANKLQEKKAKKRQIKEYRRQLGDLATTVPRANSTGKMRRHKSKTELKQLTHIAAETFVKANTQEQGNVAGTDRTTWQAGLASLTAQLSDDTREAVESHLAPIFVGNLPRSEIKDCVRAAAHAIQPDTALSIATEDRLASESNPLATATTRRSLAVSFEGGASIPKPAILIQIGDEAMAMKPAPQAAHPTTQPPSRKQQSASEDARPATKPPSHKPQSMSEAAHPATKPPSRKQQSASEDAHPATKPPPQKLQPAPQAARLATKPPLGQETDKAITISSSSSSTSYVTQELEQQNPKRSHRLLDEDEEDEQLPSKIQKQTHQLPDQQPAPSRDVQGPRQHAPPHRSRFLEDVQQMHQLPDQQQPAPSRDMQDPRQHAPPHRSRFPEDVQQTHQLPDQQQPAPSRDMQDPRQYAPPYQSRFRENIQRIVDSAPQKQRATVRRLSPRRYVERTAAWVASRQPQSTSAFTGYIERGSMMFDTRQPVAIQREQPVAIPQPNRSAVKAATAAQAKMADKINSLPDTIPVALKIRIGVPSQAQARTVLPKAQVTTGSEHNVWTRRPQRIRGTEMHRELDELRGTEMFRELDELRAELASM